MPQIIEYLHYVSLKYAPVADKKHYKYMMIDDFMIVIPLTGYEFDHDYFSLTKDGLLTIKVWYKWDGPSGPTIDTKSFMTGALVHDVLYQAMREGLLPSSLRPEADDILFSVCRRHKMNWLMAVGVLYSVKSYQTIAEQFGKGDAQRIINTRNSSHDRRRI